MEPASSSKYGATDDIDEEVSLISRNIVSSDGKEKKSAYVYYFAAGSLILITLLYSAVNTTGVHGIVSYFAKDSSSAASSLSAVVTNEYSSRNLKMFDYPFLKHALLMEPYRESTVTITGSSESCSMTWDLVSTTDAANLHWYGEVDTSGKFTVAPTKTGKYLLTVAEKCGDSTGNVLSQQVFVKYVRRELQSLTDQDREEFLDAFRTLWDVNTADGIKKYGDRYKSLWYFALIHNDAGGNSVCDEFHAGTGFVNNHVFLGAYLEQSLRLVNPRVSLHYMEYSKYFSSDDFQKHVDNQLDGGNWTEILSSKYFGSNDPITGEILDGRWAHSTIPTLDSAFFEREGVSDSKTFFPVEESVWLTRSGAHIVSPYGLLRAPWNYNPFPYTTRFNNVNRISASDVSEHALKPYMGSTCADYELFVKKDVVGQKLQSYLETSEDNVHGYVHFTFGGTGGNLAYQIDEELREKYGFSNTNLMYVAEATHKFFKSFVPLLGQDTEIGENPVTCTSSPWQNGVLTTTAAPGEDGGPSCTCSSYYLDSEDQIDTLVSLFFNHFMGDDDTINDMDFSTKREVMKLICSRMAFEGDMAGSGAATDPLFWVAHGAVERLFQRVVFENVLSDKTYFNSKRNDCSGHVDDGTKLWLEGLYFEDETIKVSELTNVELSNILDPTSDEYRDYINFVYEDSDWSWCDGFDTWFQG
jgi:hypothetical protein